MSARTVRQRGIDWALHTNASTRSSALIRVGLAAILWTRFAAELRPDFYAGERYMVLSVAFFGFTPLMFIGLFSRAATLGAGVTALSMYYYFGHELGREPWTHHHVYLLGFATLLCGLSPCGRSYSLDRWRSVRRARRFGTPAPREVGNVWALRLIALQLSALYLFSALDKLNRGFLSGDRLEHYLMYLYTGSYWPDNVLLHAFMTITAWATVLLELALAFLLFAKVRRFLAIPGLIFHGILYLVVPVLTFTATMWCLYLAFFDPDSVHRTLDRLADALGREDVASSRVSQPLS